MNYVIMVLRIERTKKELPSLYIRCIMHKSRAVKGGLTMETTASKTIRLNTLQEHVTFLSKVLNTAQRRVVIVSPFVSDHAIKADGLAGTIKELIKNKGVTVTVYTNASSNNDPDGKPKPAAVAGIKALTDMGIRVVAINGIHSKTLIRDDNLLAEGSFNWFSAVRTLGAKHQNQEDTLVTEGGDVNLMIGEAMARLEWLAKDEIMFADTTPGADKNYVEQKSCSSVVWLSDDAQKKHKKITGEDKSISKKALFALHIGFLIGCGAVPSLGVLFLIAAIVTFFMFLYRVCADTESTPSRGDTDWLSSSDDTDTGHSYTDGLAGDPAARAIYGMDD